MNDGACVRVCVCVRTGRGAERISSRLSFLVTARAHDNQPPRRRRRRDLSRTSGSEVGYARRPDARLGVARLKMRHAAERESP